MSLRGGEADVAIHLYLVIPAKAGIHFFVIPDQVRDDKKVNCNASVRAVKDD